MPRARGHQPQPAKRLLHPATFAEAKDQATALASATLEQLARGDLGVNQALALTADRLQAIWDAGTALLLSGEYERALAAFESLAVLSGPRADLAMARAACCEALGRRDRAQRYYEEALTLAPDGAHDDVRQLARMLNVSSKPEVGA